MDLKKRDGGSAIICRFSLHFPWGDIKMHYNKVTFLSAGSQLAKTDTSSFSTARSILFGNEPNVLR